jgi:outer membrane lipoprotein-sorting protein
MSKLFYIPFLVLLFFGKINQQPDATEIVRKANDLMMGRSSQSTATMTVVRPKWTREVGMKTWSLGNAYYMILITAPAQDKGQVFLKRNNEMWNWMPSISRIIRIPPSMMGQNWMGSDFTNNDLVKENSIVDDYTHKLLDSESFGGYDCYKIELMPKPNAAVVWDKIIVWIAKDKYYMLQSEFYNEDGELINREVQSDIRHFDDRDLPAKLVMTPVKDAGKYTTIEFQELKFNRDMNAEFFSQQNMKNVR